MTQIFLDLMQTPAVVLPILIGLSVVILVGVLIRTRPDKNDYALAEMRAEQEEQRDSRIDEERLMNLAETGELDSPATRLDTLNRGADIPSNDDNTIKVINTPYADMAARYGFETYKHYAKNELILFDIEIVGMDPAKRIYVLPLTTSVQPKGEPQLRSMVQTGRSVINRRAIRAGFEPVKRKPGRPAGLGVS